MVYVNINSMTLTGTVSFYLYDNRTSGHSQCNRPYIQCDVIHVNDVIGMCSIQYVVNSQVT